MSKWIGNKEKNREKEKASETSDFRRSNIPSGLPDDWLLQQPADRRSYVGRIIRDNAVERQ